MPRKTKYPVFMDEGTPPAPYVESATGDGKRFRVTLADGGTAARMQIRTEKGTLRQGPQVPVEVAEEIPAMVRAIREHAPDA